MWAGRGNGSEDSRKQWPEFKQSVGIKSSGAGCGPIRSL